MTPLNSTHSPLANTVKSETIPRHPSCHTQSRPLECPLRLCHSAWALPFNRRVLIALGNLLPLRQSRPSRMQSKTSRSFSANPLKFCPSRTIQCSQASRPPWRHRQDCSLGRPGRLSSCRARASILWERLSSKRVTVGPYSPRRIGNSRIVPAVLSRLLQSLPVFCSPRRSSAVLANYLYSQCRSVFKKDWYCIPPKSQQKSQILMVCNINLFLKRFDIASRARPSSGVTRKIAPPETPAVPASPSRAVV